MCVTIWVPVPDQLLAQLILILYCISFNLPSKWWRFEFDNISYTAISPFLRVFVLPLMTRASFVCWFDGIRWEKWTTSMTMWTQKWLGRWTWSWINQRDLTGDQNRSLPAWKKCVCQLIVVFDGLNGSATQFWYQRPSRIELIPKIAIFSSLYWPCQ